MTAYLSPQVEWDAKAQTIWRKGKKRDPEDENRLYVLSAPALRSEDGGKTWEVLEGVHGDYHDMWINPTDPDNFILADDGGAAITFDRGKSWSTQANMPTAQIYRINVDNRFPYRIYGGQQDNTSVVIASRELAGNGITTESWTSSAGGEKQAGSTHAHESTPRTKRASRSIARSSGQRPRGATTALGHRIGRSAQRSLAIRRRMMDDGDRCAGIPGAGSH